MQKPEGLLLDESCEAILLHHLESVLTPVCCRAKNSERDATSVSRGGMGESRRAGKHQGGFTGEGSASTCIAPSRGKLARGKKKCETNQKPHKEKSLWKFRRAICERGKQEFEIGEITRGRARELAS